jgi:hypothetical protein
MSSIFRKYLTQKNPWRYTVGKKGWKFFLNFLGKKMFKGFLIIMTSVETGFIV